MPLTFNGQSFSGIVVIDARGRTNTHTVSGSIVNGQAVGTYKVVQAALPPGPPENGPAALNWSGNFSLGPQAKLYGTTGAGCRNEACPSSLYSINPATGQETLVGPTGFSEVVSIDFHPVTGVLYGIANNGRGLPPAT